VAFVNNIASGCLNAGVDTYSWHSAGAGSFDQTAVVGLIAYNAASTTNLCGSGVSIIPNNGPDASAGTHVFVAGVFSYGNINGAGCSGSGQTTDGEGIIFDSWGLQGFNRQAVAEQNVMWANGSAGWEVFPNGGTDDPQIYIFANTSYGNFQDRNHFGLSSGELLLNQTSPSAGAVYSITNNIFEATMATPGGAANTCKSNGLGCQVYGAEIGCTNTCPYTTITGNYIWNSYPPTSTASGGTNTLVYDPNQGSWPFGTNTYNNPGFGNPGGLPASAPNCAAYTNTTACMNTGYQVAADLTPSDGAAGKGYQPPGACAPDAYYPTWLKGIVYLTVSGSSITENVGLITKPCGM